MNKYLIVLILIILCTLLTGCWNYRELNSIYIVAGMAIDKDDDTGMYNITIEAINMKDTDFEPNIQSYKIESLSDTVFDAVRKMVRISSKKLYWSHASTIIVSEDVARESILPSLDWIARDQEPRLAMDIYISKEKTAKELLDTQSIATDIRSYELDLMATEGKNLIEIPIIQVYQLINELSTPKTHIVIPAVEANLIHGKLTNELVGVAVFNHDKLVGYLNNDDTFSYLFLTNKVRGGLIEVEMEENPNDIVILEVFSNKTKIKPNFSEDTISFDIETKTVVNIGELKTETDYISQSGRQVLKELAEKSLQSKMEGLIKNVQSEYGIDIFGFGNIIRQRNPKLWKVIEEDWDEIFKELKVNITCDIHIRSSGHFSKPIEVVR